MSKCFPGFIPDRSRDCPPYPNRRHLLHHFHLTHCRLLSVRKPKPKIVIPLKSDTQCRNLPVLKFGLAEIPLFSSVSWVMFDS